MEAAKETDSVLKQAPRIKCVKDANKAHYEAQRVVDEFLAKGGKITEMGVVTRKPQRTSKCKGETTSKIRIEDLLSERKKLSTEEIHFFTKISKPTISKVCGELEFEKKIKREKFHIVNGERVRKLKFIWVGK